MLHNALRIQDRRVPPGHRREALSGDREGPYRMRIHDPWRLGFVERDGHACHVEIGDNYGRESR